MDAGALWKLTQTICALNRRCMNLPGTPSVSCPADIPGSLTAGWNLPHPCRPRNLYCPANDDFPPFHTRRTAAPADARHFRITIPFRTIPFRHMCSHFADGSGDLALVTCTGDCHEAAAARSSLSSDSGNALRKVQQTACRCLSGTAIKIPETQLDISTDTQQQLLCLAMVRSEQVRTVAIDQLTWHPSMARTTPCSVSLAANPFNAFADTQRRPAFKKGVSRARSTKVAAGVAQGILSAIVRIPGSDSCRTSQEWLRTHQPRKKADPLPATASIASCRGKLSEHAAHSGVSIPENVAAVLGPGSTSLRNTGRSPAREKVS